MHISCFSPDVYISSMFSVLENIESGLANGLLETDLDPLVSQLLLILALYNPKPYWNYIQLRQLFSRLLRLCMGQEVELLALDELLSVLYRVDNTYLLDEMCKIYQEVRSFLF